MKISSLANPGQSVGSSVVCRRKRSVRTRIVNGHAKNSKMKKKSDRWRDAALKSGNDALHSQNLLQDYSAKETERSRPSGSDETVAHGMGRSIGPTPASSRRWELFLHTAGEKPCVRNMWDIFWISRDMIHKSVEHWISRWRINSKEKGDGQGRV